MTDELLGNNKELQCVISFLTAVIANEAQSRLNTSHKNKNKWEKIGVLKVKEEREF